MKPKRIRDLSKQECKSYGICIIYGFLAFVFWWGVLTVITYFQGVW